jgi:Amt family ammonium transporter
MVTHLAAACGMLGWLAVEWIGHGKPTSLGAASGAVAGLVGITPAAGFVDALPGMFIGLTAGVLCYYGVRLKSRFGFDDALDVVGVHGVGGTTGAILTGVFASTAVNPAGADGLLAGNAAQLVPQIVGVLVTMVFSFAVSLAILKVIESTMGLRVDEETEERGLDIAEHAETGYVL